MTSPPNTTRKSERFRDGHGSFSASRPCPQGFTYVALLAMIVIIGIVLSAAGQYWSTAMQREKEEELLFRGEQYRLAIQRYYLAKPPPTLPASLSDLLKDDRFPQAKRHLRRPYKDLITGENFNLIRDKAMGNRIVGVYSPSEKTPIKQANFPKPYEGEFNGKQSYNEWKFQFKPQQPGQAAATD